MESKAESHKDLKVWQAGMDIAVQVHALTKSFPEEEAPGISSDMLRAAILVPSRIAEGCGSESRTEYVQFLDKAQQSLRELQTLLLLAVAVDITTQEAVDGLISLCDTEGKMLKGLSKSLSVTPASVGGTR